MPLAAREAALGGGMRFIIYRLPALLYMGLIFYVSSGPISSATVRAIPDYILHGAAYALLYVLVFRAVHEGLTVRLRWDGHWLPFLITVFYGASDEYHQSFVSGRDASVVDLLSDAVGAVVGIWLVVGTARVISAFPSRRPV